MKQTHLKFFVLILLFCICFTTPCLAAQSISFTEDQMALQIPDDFALIQQTNVEGMASALAPYNTTVTETSLKLQQGNYLFLGISSTMQCTLFLAKQEDTVSRSVQDLITYQDRQTVRELLLGKNLPDTMQVQELEQRGALFYRVNCGVTNGIGRIVYITIMNGACYSLCVIDNTGNLNDNINALIDTVFKTWDYTIDAETQQIDAFRSRATTRLFWIGVPLALVAVGFILRSLVRDLKKRRLETDRRNNVPKRPRR